MLRQMLMVGWRLPIQVNAVRRMAAVQRGVQRCPQSESQLVNLCLQLCVV